jgi:hypothetical protein
MANAVRGETEFVCGGKTYNLLFSVNALCALEGQLGEGITKITEMLSNPADLRLTSVRALFWAGLRDHHPEVDLTEAGVMMTEMGNLAAIDMLGKAFALSFPDVRGPLEARAKPRAGTGKRS